MSDGNDFRHHFIGRMGADEHQQNRKYGGFACRQQGGKVRCRIDQRCRRTLQMSEFVDETQVFANGWDKSPAQQPIYDGGMGD